MGTAASVVG